jgi:hypothetical protein
MDGKSATYTVASFHTHTPMTFRVTRVNPMGRILDPLALMGAKAIDAAEKVRRWGDIVELEPLNAFDRRIIHNALKDDPSIETHSVEVEGSNKKAIILRPKH